jgi:hypothetical protein
MTNETMNARKAKPELLLANWQGELDAVHLYRYLAAHETDEQRASVLKDMAEMESHHARVMERGLQEHGVSVPPHRLSFKTRLLEYLIVGGAALVCALAGGEISGTANYAGQARVAELASEERSHAPTLVGSQGAQPRRVLAPLSRRRRPARGRSASATGSCLPEFGDGFAGASADASSSCRPDSPASRRCCLHGCQRYVR